MLGIIMLIIAVAVQIGYAVFCIIKGEKSDRIKHILRLALTVLFIGFILLFGHGWSFQWTMLMITMAVLLLISFVQVLLAKKRAMKKKPFRKWRVILAAMGSCIYLFIGLLPAIVFPPYEHPVVTGDYEVAYETYSYIDETREETYRDTGEKRQVNVAFWYPEDVDGTYPLVVFSHGYGGIKNSNESTYMELASHGYVVCSVDHPYQSFYTTNDEGKVTIIDNGYLQEYSELVNANTYDVRFELYGKWMDIRVADLDFVIDTILESEGGVYGLVDADKIGVFGHSLGGAAAMGIPRVRDDIDAVVNIDAPMLCEFTGVQDEQYTLNEEPYPAPVLNIYSEYLYENGILREDPDYVANRLVQATAPASYEVVFTGAQHMSLTDLSLFSPILANMLNGVGTAEVDPYECLETMNSVILEFFDCYLKDEGTFTSEGTY